MLESLRIESCNMFVRVAFVVPNVISRYLVDMHAQATARRSPGKDRCATLWSCNLRAFRGLGACAYLVDDGHQQIHQCRGSVTFIVRHRATKKVLLPPHLCLLDDAVKVD